MSDKEQMIHYLVGMSSEKKEIRDQSEATLLNAAKVNADIFVSTNLSIIEDATVQENLRNTAVVLLQKTMSLMEEDGIKAYLLLSNEGREGFQRRILIQLAQVKESSVRNNIADLISKIGSSLALEENLEPAQRWPTLFSHLMEVLALNQKQAVISVFRIFEGLFSNASKHFEGHRTQICQIFSSAFNQPDIEIVVAAIEALRSLVQTLLPKLLKPFKPFAAEILKVAMRLAKEKDEENLSTVVDCLFDICESEPAFLKRHYGDLILVMEQVRLVNEEPEDNLKLEAVETLVIMLEKYPDLAKKDTTSLKKVLELIFLNMIELEDEIAPEWSSPPDGFNDDLEEDDDQNFIKIGMDFIDRIINSVGPNLLLPILSECFQTLLSTPDWKKHHAAIMAISQVGEYMTEKVQEVQPILQVLLNFSKNPNPRIRYACCHCSGQFADDLAPEFQNRYSQEYFAIVLPMLNDPVPRVVAHALASLTNFLESVSAEQLAPFFSQLYMGIVQWLDKGISYVREACFSTLSALCEGASNKKSDDSSTPNLFEGVYPQVMEFIFSTFKNSTSKEYRQLRGNAIECATIIGKTCNIELFKPYADALIREMITLQNGSVNSEELDPQKSYLLAGWQRICMTLESQLLPYLGQIVPNLIEILKISIKNTEHGFVSHQIEEAKTAVETLSIFLNNLGKGMTGFIEQIYEALMLMVESDINEETRRIAIECLPGLVKIFKAEGQNAPALAKSLVDRLWVFLKTENEAEIICESLMSIQKILKYVENIYSDRELLGIYDELISHMHRSEERKKNAEDFLDPEEETAEDIENHINGEKESEDGLKLEVANTFGAIFRSHKSLALPVFQKVCQELILPSVSSKVEENLLFGLFLVDDSIEHLGRLIAPEILSQFFSLLISHASSSNTDIQQCSVFGIGIVAKVFGTDFLPFFENSVKVLTGIIEEKGKELDDLGIVSIRDNAVSSFGKMIEAVGSSLPVDRCKLYLDYWLKQLPLITDAKESIIQNTLFINLLSENPALLINDNATNLKHILYIIVKLVSGKKKKFSTIEQRSKMTALAKAICNNDAYRQILSTIQFTPEENAALTALINPPA